MKTLLFIGAFLMCTATFGQVQLQSFGLNAKTDRFNFKDSKMFGYDFTLQTVLDNNLILNADFGRAESGWWYNELSLFGVRTGTFVDNFTTVGGNIGYRFHPHKNLKFDLTGGLVRYSFNERIIYKAEWYEGEFYRSEIRRMNQKAAGLGANANLRANWLFSKHVGLNVGIGVQSHIHTEPYVQVGIEFGFLRK